MFASFEHEEHCAQELVLQRDDRAFVAVSDDERLELGLEDGRGAAGGMREFAQ